LARRYSDRKALSPVISTLLMISATITMFVILFAGFVPSITLTQSQANIWYSQQGDAARERIVIEMVVFNIAAKSVDVYVRNVQDIEVGIREILIIKVGPNEPVLAIDQGSITPPLPARVCAKTSVVSDCAPVQKFTVPCPTDSLVPNKDYDIIVVTARGSNAVSRVRAN